MISSARNCHIKSICQTSGHYENTVWHSQWMISKRNSPITLNNRRVSNFTYRMIQDERLSWSFSLFSPLTVWQAKVSAQQSLWQRLALHYNSCDIWSEVCRVPSHTGGTTSYHSGRSLSSHSMTNNSAEPVMDDRWEFFLVARYFDVVLILKCDTSRSIKSM